MGRKALGYDSIEKLLGENKINPDHFQLKFGDDAHLCHQKAYPNRIKLEYEHDIVVEWDTIEWGDARILLYLYLAAVYYPPLVVAYDELHAEKSELGGRVYNLEQELKAARETITRQEAQLTEIRETAKRAVAG